MHWKILKLLAVYTILHDFFFFLYSFSSISLASHLNLTVPFYGSCGNGCFYLLFCFSPIRKNRENEWKESSKKILKKKQKINMQVLRREVERTMNKQREKRRGQRKKLVAICAALLLCIFVMFLLFPCSNFSFSWWFPLSWTKAAIQQLLPFGFPLPFFFFVKSLLLTVSKCSNYSYLH